MLNLSEGVSGGNDVFYPQENDEVEKELYNTAHDSLGNHKNVSHSQGYCDVAISQSIPFSDDELNAKI